MVVLVGSGGVGGGGGKWGGRGVLYSSKGSLDVLPSSFFCVCLL